MKIPSPLNEPNVPQTSNEGERRDVKLLKAARMFEKQFLSEMVRAMRRTVQNGGLIETSMGEGIFREKLDDEYVEAWGEKGGIGLADVIYKQVAERYGIGSQPQTFERANGTGQFMPLDSKNLAGAKATSMNIQLAKGEPQVLRAPWSGRLLSQGRLDDGRVWVRIRHDLEKLDSDFIYRGALPQFEQNQTINKGDILGQLNSGSFEWKINPRPSS